MAKEKGLGRENAWKNRANLTTKVDYNDTNRRVLHRSRRTAATNINEDDYLLLLEYCEKTKTTVSQLIKSNLDKIISSYEHGLMQ